MKRIAIFASGTGSNAGKIIDFFKNDDQVRVDLVISNKADAPVLEMARKEGVETYLVNKAGFYESRELLGVLRNRQIDLIVLAGFLWLVPAYLIEAFPNKIINIHPALLPGYGGKGMYGMHVHEAVKKAGETRTGITIHYVNEHYDEGNIIFQSSCEINSGDSAEEIALKVRDLEHRHFAPVIAQLLKD
ncbi:MAG: phosphoribosylglycinamide formyltransferase [Lewinellaceae bacterium]|nr:phosphoribosylglycinamide formyltransferase [Lewinellaceae bacterium]